MSNSTRLIIGTAVGFASGLGLMNIHPADASYLTDNVDAVVGGALALVSLIGFIQHHIEQGKTQVTTTQPTTTVVTPANP